MRVRRLLAHPATVSLALLLAAPLLDGCADDPSAGDPGRDAGADTDTDTEPDGGPDGGGEPDSPWSEAVDAFWGAAPNEAQRSAVFDALWEGLSDEQATFATNDLDWDAVRETYGPLAAQAESMGRLYAVLGEVVHLFEDGHTAISSATFCDYSKENLSQRPPLFVRYGIYSALGVCAAPTDEGALVVYAAAEDNPAGLVPGDVLLGYDGRPWSENLAEIEAAHLPICGRSFPLEISDDSVAARTAVNNAHLFAELDVVRAATSAAEAIPTAELLDYESDALCTSQLPVPGVARPYDTKSALAASEPAVTWGIVEGTNVGYVYAYDFASAATGDLFEQAVVELWETDGLVIDLRFNVGGSSLNSFGALARLFNEDLVGVYVMYVRDPDAEDRDAMVPSTLMNYDLDADEATFYDKPIALLTGPDDMSAGEGVAHLLSHHPRVRRFGLPSSGSFGSVEYLFSPSSPALDDIVVTYCSGILSDGEGNWLHGAPQAIDEELWLTADDILAGADTVVDAALAWIATETSGG